MDFGDWQLRERSDWLSFSAGSQQGSAPSLSPALLTPKSCTHGVGAAVVCVCAAFGLFIVYWRCCVLDCDTSADFKANEWLCFGLKVSFVTDTRSRCEEGRWKTAAR